MCLAIPGRVVTAEPGALRMGRVSFAGVIREVCLHYAPEAAVGDYVLVHAGFAIARLDEQQARAALEALDEALRAEPEPGGEAP